MTGPAGLEQRYRRLLAWYPEPFRSEREVAWPERRHGQSASPPGHRHSPLNITVIASG